MDRSLKTEELAETIATLQAKRFRPLRGARVTVAADRGESGTMLLAGKAVFSDNESTARESAAYGRLLLLEEWIAPIEIALVRLRQLLSGEGSVGGIRMCSKFSDRLEVEENRRQGETISGWFETAIRAVADGRDVDLGNEPVVRFGLRPYKSPGSAINEWVWNDRTSERSSAQRLRSLLISMPDTRARIAEADWTSVEWVTVTVEATIPLADLELQVCFDRIDASPLVLSIETPTVTLSVPKGASGVHLFLVHATGDLLGDWTLSALTRRNSGEAQQSRPVVEQASQDIGSGEGEEVEYKPFIKPGHEKEYEVVRTIVAFANTRGGRVYFGVAEKTGQPSGIPAFSAAYGKAPMSMRDEIEQHMRKLIGDRVRGTGLRWRVDVVEIRGDPVGVLRIEPGTAPPYATHDDDVLVRKGSTNRRPDSQTELLDLCSRRRRDVPPLYGDLFGTIIS